MRIAINCRSFSKKQYTGIGRYAYNLVKSLSDIDQENEYLLYLKKNIFDRKRTIPKFSANNFVPKIDIWNRSLNKVLKNVDVYHIPCFDDIKFTQGKIVVSVHDLIFKTYPSVHTKETRDISEKHLQAIVKYADRIICSSISTMQDIKKFYDIEEHRLSVIHPGINKDAFYALDDNEKVKALSGIKLKGVGEKFVLFVGTIEPRKNLINLLKAFSTLKERNKYNGQLVVVGMKGWMIDNIGDTINDLNIKNDVVFLGYLSDEELCCLYNLTDVFVYPSFYEGFGFPILEAFNCGSPVITSDVSSCPEIAGDGAVTFNPNDVEGLSNIMDKMLNDREKRESIKQKGIRRAEDFSFEKTAVKTLKIYKEVCSNKGQK